MWRRTRKISEINPGNILPRSLVVQTRSKILKKYFGAKDIITRHCTLEIYKENRSNTLKLVLPTYVTP